MTGSYLLRTLLVISVCFVAENEASESVLERYSRELNDPNLPSTGCAEENFSACVQVQSAFFRAISITDITEDVFCQGQQKFVDCIAAKCPKGSDTVSSLMIYLREFQLMNKQYMCPNLAFEALMKATYGSIASVEELDSYVAATNECEAKVYKRCLVNYAESMSLGMNPCLATMQAYHCVERNTEMACPGDNVAARPYEVTRVLANKAFAKLVLAGKCDKFTNTWKYTAQSMYDIKQQFMQLMTSSS
ncbi:unnamed protein product [Owenia fusiformis]|uniref:Uncharacterized protein n=1 Tax=Owenia fusiformis TaxID=6347 RepID=A0A8J1TB09_OWEFU|nr:unnamed protein product [Owenia fusiformis]